MRKFLAYSFRHFLLAMVLTVSGTAGVALADGDIPSDVPPISGEPASLVDAWFLLPDLRNVDWGFAFVSTPRTQNERTHQQQALVTEIRRIRRKFASKGDLAMQLDAWETNARRPSVFRVPGHWGPAYLMAHPRREPPLASLSVLGICRAVDTVEVWDTRGVRDIAWSRGMTLDELRNSHDIVPPDGADNVTVIQPWGERIEVGIAAWNRRDVELIGGARVVTPLYLPGAATGWLNRALPDFLAHVVSGTRCRQWTGTSGR